VPDQQQSSHGRKQQQSTPSGRSSSGRTTPAGRSMADMRIHPWSYGHAVGALRDLAERGRRQSPDGAADWSGERVFVREGAGSAAGHHQHSHQQQRQQQEQEHQHRQRGSSAKEARALQLPAGASSRQPRRDWGTEERAKREERTVGILGSSGRGSSRASPEEDVEDDEEEEEEEEGGEEEETTALPQMRGRTSGSREREREKERERHLLDRMIFKKKRGAGG
jgi:hypothetical protein